MNDPLTQPLSLIFLFYLLFLFYLFVKSYPNIPSVLCSFSILSICFLFIYYLKMNSGILYSFMFYTCFLFMYHLKNLAVCIVQTYRDLSQHLYMIALLLV